MNDVICSTPEDQNTPEDIDSFEKFEEAFRNLFVRGYKMVVDGCRIFSRALLTNPEWCTRLKHQHPEIPESIWHKVEQVGNGNLHPDLLTDNSSYVKIIAGYPFSIQEKILKEEIDVLTFNGDTLKVKIQNFTPDITKQVLAKDGPRDLPAQRAYLESLKTKKKIERDVKEITKVYTVEKNRVIFSQGAVVSKAMLIKILGEMI